MKNKEEKEMLKALKEKSWAIINESIEEESKIWTYLGENETSVIDHVVANRGATEKVMEFKIGNTAESDHLLVEIEIQCPITGGEEKKENEEIIESCD